MKSYSRRVAALSLASALAVSHNASATSWQPISGTNIVNAFDVNTGLLCMALYNNDGVDNARQVECENEEWENGSGIKAGTAPGVYLGWLDNNNAETPVATQSLAIQEVANDSVAYVYALGSDGVVRVTGAYLGAAPFVQPYFGHWVTYVNPVDSGNNPINLVKIVNVFGYMLMGLSSTGQMYVARSPMNSSSVVWFPASQFQPWSNLSASLRWKDISHDNLNNGMALLSTGTPPRVWRIESTSVNGVLTFSVPTMLPLISYTASGSTYTANPVAIGGSFVITDASDGLSPTGGVLGVGYDGDDNRFYQWNVASRTWAHLNIGTPRPPVSAGPPPIGDLPSPQPYLGIVDAPYFSGKSQTPSVDTTGFAVWSKNADLDAYLP